MKRNTSKEKSKRNKGYPHKSRLNSLVITKERHHLVDAKGKVVASFRLYFTPRSMLSYYEKTHGKLTIRDDPKDYDDE